MIRAASIDSSHLALSLAAALSPLPVVGNTILVV